MAPRILRFWKALGNTLHMSCRRFDEFFGSMSMPLNEEASKSLRAGNKSDRCDTDDDERDDGVSDIEGSI